MLNVMFCGLKSFCCFSGGSLEMIQLISMFFSFTEAFEYLTLDLNRVPGQGLGLSIVGRR